jgi:hypothetical protein
VRVGALVATLAALSLGACGDDSGEDDPGAPDGAAGATELTIALDADGPGGEPETKAEIACAATDTDAEAGHEACRVIERLTPEAAEPIPQDVACTEIYGGPDLARVEGTLEGEPVHLRLTRANGCEIARFDLWTPLLRRLFPGYRPGAALGA